MTVERSAMVEFWPLVDIGKLDVRDGDLLVISVRDPALLEMPARQHLRTVIDNALPGVRLIIAKHGTLEFVVKRAMPDMRAEDLHLPRRPTTME